MAISNVLIWFFVGVIFALGSMIFLLARRKMMSYELIMVLDNRTGATPGGRIRYNLRLGMKDGLKAIKIYNRLISIMPARVDTSIADPRPFVWWGRTILGVVGPTGEQEDDNIVLLKKPRMTPLDIDRWSHGLSNNINQSLIGILSQMGKDGESIDSKTLAEHIENTFNKKWVLDKEGAGASLIEKGDLIPRSHKVAYQSEMEHATSLENAHRDLWGRIAQFGPIIMMAVFIIAVGISLNIFWGATQKATQAEQAYGQQLYTWQQAQSLEIGKALAAVGVYGYAVNLTQPPTAPNDSLTQGLVPSTPTLPKT